MSQTYLVAGASGGIGLAVAEYLTVINPGNVGTDEVVEDLKQRTMAGARPIPMADLLAAINCVLKLSRDTCIMEIELPAMVDYQTGMRQNTSGRMNPPP